MEIVIKSVDELHEDENGFWSGKVRIEARSDISVNNFVIPFERRKSVDEGVMCSMSPLHYFGKKFTEAIKVWENEWMARR
jgi:hypothetical protein